MHNPYQTRRGFLPDPFAFLYHAPDEEVTHYESVEALSVIPSCEAQARPLTKFYGAELYPKWQTVFESLVPHTTKK